MPKFEILAPDGHKYEIEADTVEKANADLKAYRLEELKAKQAGDIEASPAWTRPFVAAHDLGRSTIDNLTLGGLSRAGDYFAGDDSVSLSTQAAKDRAGWAGTALDVATAAKYLPTLVPRAVGAVGGGPGVRAITAGATGAAEGGALGGVEAAMRDKDVATGTGVGGVAGILGQAVGGVVNKAKRAWDEASIPAIGKVGKSFEAPAYNVRRLPKGATADPQLKVNVAASKAEAEAAKHLDDPLARQKAYADEFTKLQETKGFKKEFTKSEKEQIQKIISGDFGTNAARQVGNYASNPFLMGGVGAGMGGIPGVLAATTLGLGGGAAKKLSAGGTDEAVRDLRRAMYGIDKFRGPVSDEWKRRMSRGLGATGMEWLNE